MRTELPPGRVGVVHQYIDFTGAATTFFEDDAKFTSVTQPFDARLNAALLKTLRAEQSLEQDALLEFTLWLSTGPQYETEAEVTAAERLGADLVGMTAPREAKLCVSAAATLPFAGPLAGDATQDPNPTKRRQSIHPTRHTAKRSAPAS